MDEIILKTTDLSVDFKVKRKALGRADRLSAVHRANIEVRRGEIYGLVGESGCGKTTLANAILGFTPITSGSFTFLGHTVTANTKPGVWHDIRKHMQVIFQDPYSSVDPRLTVWQIVSEPLYIAGERDERVLKERSAELLEKVGLGKEDLERHTFEFSGGQKQRIAIARALITGAEFIVCDEPTTALDVSVHSQICNLLLDLQQELGLTYFFISHNLSLIRHITTHMAVMYLGDLMESGSTGEIFRRPACPYTEALMSAILEAKPTTRRERMILHGEAVSPINPGPGCRFAGRCPHATEACRRESLTAPVAVGEDHYTNCLMYKE